MGYITNDEAAKWIGLALPLTADQDAIITSLIATVSECIDAYTETRFDGAQVKTNELHDAARNDVICFEQWPVISVQAVKVGVGGDGSGGVVVAATEYNFDDSELRFRFLSLPLQRGYVRLDYTWGYATVPERVKQACKIGVEGYWRHRARQAVGIASKSKEGESISYRGTWDAQAGLPKESVSLLADFRFCEWPSGARGEMATRRS
jgi:SRSO17 transposase